jgi:hypothetical protein
MQNYYVIFDVDQDIIGVSNVYSNATLVKGPIPPKLNPSKGPDNNGGKNGNNSTNPGTPSREPEVQVILVLLIVLLTLFIILLLLLIYVFGFKKAVSPAKEPAVYIGKQQNVQSI